MLTVFELRLPNLKAGFVFNLTKGAENEPNQKYGQKNFFDETNHRIGTALYTNATKIKYVGSGRPKRDIYKENQVNRKRKTFLIIPYCGFVGNIRL